MLEGVSCHIGSQLLDTAPMMQAFEKVVALADRLRASGIPIRTLDFGGGLGVAYKPGDRHRPRRISSPACSRRRADADLEIMVEPGRSIVAEAGALLTRVLYRKSNGAKNFVIVDAAMNDLLRPALYRSASRNYPRAPQ